MAELENQSSQPCESNGETKDNNCSATFLDLEALDCPICTDALTTPILQCDSGHIACSTCCNKLRNKCPACALPIGHIRCRAMERVIKAVIVQCPNAKFGCTQKFSYGKQIIHEKECTFSLCSCPAQNCNYAASFKDLYTHFLTHYGERIGHQFLFGESLTAHIYLTEHSSFVMKEYNHGLLFVVQCFLAPYGVYVTVRVIAPSFEVGEFSCHISTCVEKYNLTFESPKVKRIRKMSFQTPEEDFMLVPSYLLFDHQLRNLRRQTLKLRICIKKLNQEKTFESKIYDAKNVMPTKKASTTRFGDSPIARIDLTEYYTSVFMKEYNHGLLFVVQCFLEPYGVYVTVSCIAPSAVEVGEFSCHISTCVEKYNLTFESPKVKRIRTLSFQTPVEDFMLVPSYLLIKSQSLNLKRQALKIEICINKLNQESKNKKTPK